MVVDVIGGRGAQGATREGCLLYIKRGDGWNVPATEHRSATSQAIQEVEVES